MYLEKSLYVNSVDTITTIETLCTKTQSYTISLCVQHMWPATWWEGGGGRTQNESVLKVKCPVCYMDTNEMN